jgi:hypothetical protein
MKKTLLITLLCFLTINIQGQSKKESFLEILERSYDQAPNSANLAKYLNKLKGDINNISKSFKSLKWAISNNKRSWKKKHAQAIKNKTEVLMRNCLLSYKYAENITSKLKISSEQKQKMFSLKTEISYLYKSGESLVITCDFLIKKPGKLTRKKFNSMVDSYQLGKEYNRLMKKTKVLLKVAIVESNQ